MAMGQPREGPGHKANGAIPQSTDWKQTLPLPTPLEPGIPALVFPFHISTLRADIAKLKEFGTCLQEYCIRIIQTEREKAELGSPPTLTSTWLRDKYYRDNTKLNDDLRYFSRIFPSLKVLALEFIPIQIIGWLFTAVEPEDALAGLLKGRTQMLFALEDLIRRDIPVYIFRVAKYFQMKGWFEKGIFTEIKRGSFFECATRIVELCDFINCNYNMKILEDRAEAHRVWVKDLAEKRLPRDPKTGYIICPRRDPRSIVKRRRDSPEAGRANPKPQTPLRRKGGGGPVNTGVKRVAQE
ncbi:hypothetical protein TWF481_011708 [Arthrobotrys musiformis]|uniref:Uncharacterized protein n=1 Tax=Arthrobotrys musiformis TaxID=47236 RepID=A0AAV9W085_9PEZI